MTSFTRRVLFALSLLCASTVANATPQSGDFQWMIVPYGWFASVGTDLRTNEPPTSISNQTSFSDIVDKIDGVAQIHGEGQGDHFGVFADFMFVGLSESHDRPLIRTESDLDTRMFELAAVWHPGDKRGFGWEPFAGLRMMDMDTTVQFIPVNPLFPRASVNANEMFTDLMVGVRYTFPMSDRWSMTLRGDGSWGNTEGTWNASAIAMYRTRNGGWFFGYRYMDIKVEPGNTEITITLKGPGLGYGFRF